LKKQEEYDHALARAEQLAMQLSTKETLLHHRQIELQSRDQLIEAKDQIIEGKDTLIETKDQMIEDRENYIASQQEILNERDEQLQAAVLDVETTFDLQGNRAHADHFLIPNASGHMAVMSVAEMLELVP